VANTLVMEGVSKSLSACSISCSVIVAILKPPE
jgi:hypothetical protein